MRIVRIAADSFIAVTANKSKFANLKKNRLVSESRIIIKINSQKYYK